jgi:outer membrane protein OmpA-like peptidoglycan-associated protein
MFGPAVGPWRRNCFALTMATAMFVGVSGTCAMAQDRPEAVIGTFESTNSARAAQGKPGTFDFEPSPARPTTSPVDDDVSRLFSSALDDLEAGRGPIAQRKLEQVIARDPDGHLAKSARGYLADLYRNAPGSPRAAAAPAAAAQPKFETPRSGLGAGVLAKEAAAPAAKTVMPPEALGIAVAAVVEEDFIVSAGDRVFFANGSAELGQRARIVLAAQARWLAGHPELKAVVEGHADDGTLPADQMAKLSEARAMAVRDRLVEEGIDSSRLSITALGRKAPVADCPGPDCAAQNRRAITVLRTQVREFGQRQRGQSVASESVRAPMP